MLMCIWYRAYVCTADRVLVKVILAVMKQLKQQLQSCFLCNFSCFITARITFPCIEYAAKRFTIDDTSGNWYSHITYYIWMLLSPLLRLDLLRIANQSASILLKSYGHFEPGLLRFLAPEINSLFGLQITKQMSAKQKFFARNNAFKICLTKVLVKLT